MRRAGPLLACLMSIMGISSSSAQQGWFSISPSAVFETGDSWTDGAVTHHLYGVQACLRGTKFTNAHGQARDCGEASLAMLVALIRDLRPQCYVAATLPQTKSDFVFCVAQPTTGVGTGSRLDLGTALIASGYAFAALEPTGRPVYAPYFVAQLVAHRSGSGLWAFADLPDPNTIIMHALGAGPSGAQAIPHEAAAPGPAPR